MEDATKFVSFAVTGLTMMGGLYGGVTYTHDHLQQVDTMQQSIMLIDMRMDMKILSDRATALQARLWKIEERYGADLFDAPGTVRDEYKAISAELEALKHDLLTVQQEYRRQGQSSGRYYERKPIEVDK